MRVKVAIPEAHVTAPILNATLEAVTRLDEQLIKARSVPTWAGALRAGVQWRPEPPGDEHFDHAGLVMKRGWLDCDDAAPYAAGSLRAQGIDPGARAIVRRSGPNRWHAVVRRSDGSIEDPSLDAGMAPGIKAGVFGATLPRMFSTQDRVRGEVGAYISSPEIALRPVHRRGKPLDWQARADLPWHWQPGQSPSDIAMASLHRSSLPDQAVVGACLGAVAIGEAAGNMSDYDMDRMEAIAGCCQGVSWEEIAAEYGEDHADAAGAIIDGFFGSLLKKAKKFAKKGLKLVPDLVSFVPGVGPMASMAIRKLSPALLKSISKGKHVRPKHRRRTIPVRRPTTRRIVRPPTRRIVRPAAPRITYPRPSSGSPPQAFVCYPAPSPNWGR